MHQNPVSNRSKNDKNVPKFVETKSTRVRIWLFRSIDIAADRVQDTPCNHPSDPTKTVHFSSEEEMRYKEVFTSISNKYGRQTVIVLTR